ncbi:MAG: hypothetical protein JO184_13675 [Gammaproteobacteria bacterium]|nr:hypothetical protein [Gammaproteobacteria bacterium]
MTDAMASGRGTTGPLRVDLAVHARGKSVEDVKLRFAQTLRVPPNSKDILNALQESDAIRCIIVDALDEAAEPAAIVHQLLAPMTGMRTVRLVLGARTNLLPLLREIEVINIDRPQYADKRDIAHYVAARLMRRDEPGAATPYQGAPDLAERVAARVADRAYPNFLVARLIAEHLLTKSKAADPDDATEIAFPTRVDAAFAAYLVRFGGKEVAVRDLLRPLAFAEGQGLPWDNIWAPLASALSGREYRDNDIRQMLRDAGAFVLETTEQGRSVYRLYHQALADVIRKEHRLDDVDHMFTVELTKATPRRAGTEQPDWLVTSAYVRLHLATHAGRCGMLTTLLRDPAYLLAAEQVSLLRAMSTDPSREAKTIEAVYRGVVHHLHDEPVGVSASYLELVARQRGLADFADTIEAMPLARPWRPTWALWQPRTPTSRAVAKGTSTSPISDLTVLAADTDVLLALGRDDGAVELWDVLTGEPLRRWRPGPVDVATHVSLGITSAGRFLVASWASGHLGSLNLETGEAALTESETRSESESRRDVAVRALCIAEREKDPVCITAHRDNSLCIRALPGLAPIMTRTTPTPAGTYGLRVIELDDSLEPVLVSVGDSRAAPLDAERYDTLHLFSLRDLSVLWAGDRSAAVLKHIELATLAGRNVAVVSQDHWGPAQIWDLKRRMLLYQGQEASDKAWILDLGDGPILLEVRFGQFESTRLPIACGDAVISAGEYREPVPTDGRQFSTIVGLRQAKCAERQ